MPTAQERGDGLQLWRGQGQGGWGLICTPLQGRRPDRTDTTSMHAAASVRTDPVIRPVWAARVVCGLPTTQALR